MAAFKAGFAAVLFTAFLAVLLWGDLGGAGMEGFASADCWSTVLGVGGAISCNAMKNFAADN